MYVSVCKKNIVFVNEEENLIYFLIRPLSPWGRAKGHSGYVGQECNFFWKAHLKEGRKQVAGGTFFRKHAVCIYHLNNAQRFEGYEGK